MSQQLDELFGSEGAQPATGHARLLLIGGLVLTLLGLGCTSVPGGLLVLWGFLVTDRELEKVDAGYLAEVHRSSLQNHRRAAVAAVFLVLAVFVLQGLLLGAGFYHRLWHDLLSLAIELGGGDPAALAE